MAGRLLRRSIGAANAVMAPVAAYLAAQTVIALAADRRPRADGDTAVTGEPTTRFVVLVPAHDEETTIGTMLSSMGAQSYPAELFDVHVVADNCSDRTSDIVRSAGFRAHERDAPDDPGKGPALNWLLDRLTADGAAYDVVVFVDADTTVAPGFLRALDGRFRRGAKAVQGHYGVRDAFSSTPATLRYCALAARHHLRPLARTTIGGSCGLFGNGMAFARPVVEGRRWTAHLVEDMEFQLELLTEGIIVEYEPAARVEAEMPHTFRNSVTQHQRWEAGRLSLVRRFVPRLVAEVARPRRAERVAAADAIADACVPPLSLLGGAALVSTAVGGAAAALSPRYRGAWKGGAVVTAVLVVHVVVAMRMVRAPRAAYVALLQAPRLAVWKAWIMLRSAGGADWVRTTRNAEPDNRGGDES